ncbi:helix-turn-helix domain-containing protein [uncultured Pseudodesulfovibrio sp.]|uniref:helix-turn-helix domain-containing protein n=1 Tax=uncultured Pseudodesulfovibrio sp. TaxID=2035858 RepID=UPI0029C6B75E|nr:helix-turn-helix domain-containing protein [uncultured Pseudodesulfovibrio sp.]
MMCFKEEKGAAPVAKQNAAPDTSPSQCDEEVSPDSSSKVKQKQVLDANLAWVHMFKTIFESGDVARMKPNAFTVLMCLKSYSNWKSGTAFPEVKTIVADTGICKNTVMKALQDLVAMGYVLKTRRGRKNFYLVKEKIPLYAPCCVEIKGKKRQPHAMADFLYSSQDFMRCYSDIKSILTSGKVPPDGKVRVENLNVNVNIQVVKEGAVGVQINIPSGYPGKWSTQDLENVLGKSSADFLNSTLGRLVSMEFQKRENSNG